MRNMFSYKIVIASLIAGAVALLPFAALMASQIYYPDLNDIDDAGYRGAAIAIGLIPFLYIATVFLSFLSGSLLVKLNSARLSKFMLGASIIAILFGLIISLAFEKSSKFGVYDALLSSLFLTLSALVSILPAAICWWLIAVKPHNPSIKRDALRRVPYVKRWASQR